MDSSQIFMQVFIYLLSAVIAVPISKRFGFGSVLGYLAAGIIIGPFVLKLTSIHTENIMHFAEFGIVMMLFLIGLELRPSMLWELRRKLVFVGGIQVVATTLIITAIAKICGLDTTASFVIGMILTASSTALVLQMLHEKGWINFDVGNTIFAVLLFQDIAVIPMLAIFPLLGNSISISTSLLNKWQQIIIMVCIIIIIIGGSKYLLRPIFRFIADSKLNEAFTALTLLLVIGITMVMNYIGLSPALGAFLAGVMLAESEYRHELEADIQPFKGLLLGLFFISVGTNIDFNLISKHLFLIVALVLGLMLIKFIILFCLGKFLSKNKKDIWLISLTLAQGGEFCFVLISYANENAIFSGILARQLTAVVALSMLLTPIVMMTIYDKIIAKPTMENEADAKFDVTSKEHQVVIAGFGRFGQIVSRYLLANGIKSTILDIDPNQVDTVRKFGYKVFYGDARRIDLLEIAGIAKANLFIIAIDDSAKAIEIAVIVRKMYPTLKILLRVRNRTDVYEALNYGFKRDDIYREIFDSALHLATDSLSHLGFSKEMANNSAKLFRKIDEAQLQKMYAHYTGKMNDDYVTQARVNMEQLENILRDDMTSINSDLLKETHD